MLSDLVEELVGLSDAALDERIRANESERRRLDAELAAAVAVADHRRLYAADGHRSMAAYLRATLNYSTGEASRLRSLSQAVDRIDGLGDAWSGGHIGRSQATEFGRIQSNRRVRDQVGPFAPMLLEQAEQLPHREFVACVDHFIRTADTDGSHHERDEQIEHRDAHVSEVGGTLKVDAHGGDPLAAAEAISIFERFVEAEFQADLAARRAEHGDASDGFDLARTPKQRRHDALIAIFRRAAASDTATGAKTDPLVNILIDADTWARLFADSGLAATTDLDGHRINPFTGSTDPADLLDALSVDPDTRCETTRGQQLHPHDVLRAALSGHVRRVVVDTAGTVIDLGRKSRVFTGSARQAAKLLITGCEHPGCALPADFCQVDHATGWVDGGRTDQRNTAIRCAGHNNDKHRHRWRSRRATNGRTFTIRADGTIMLPVGCRPPTFAATDDHPEMPDPIELERIRRHVLQRLARPLAS
ncbi:HNH endonuclease signature motif containing protein [Ilumatobacter nonamiensis]|uniref:HNH endonuclease signature motif containing protein n=1 Tax=Ilumatobacter nonamiensis TaxID=467093 RepID=UPI00034736E5|nr:HNH endonuclease signature motif containing protein [Ilumatobacter nonamiensis]